MDVVVGWILANLVFWPAIYFLGHSSRILGNWLTPDGRRNRRLKREMNERPKLETARLAQRDKRRAELEPEPPRGSMLDCGRPPDREWTGSRSPRRTHISRAATTDRGSPADRSDPPFGHRLHAS